MSKNIMEMATLESAEGIMNMQMMISALCGNMRMRMEFLKE